LVLSLIFLDAFTTILATLGYFTSGHSSSRSGR
jgi:hypothetical protein